MKGLASRRIPALRTAMQPSRHPDQVEPIRRRTLQRDRPLLPGEADRIIEAAGGIEQVCEWISAGAFLVDVAERLEIGRMPLTRWIARDEEREKAVHAARLHAAEAFVALAERVVAEAQSGVEVSRARELAHHYRWTAERMHPGRYGAKVEVKHVEDVKELRDDELDRRIRRLAAQAAAGQAATGAEPPAEPAE